MAGLTTAGLETKSLDEINTELDDGIHADVSPTLNLSATAPIGEYKGVTASQLAQLWEAMQSLWASWDPSQATGAALDRLGALTGTRRRAATKSKVLMTLGLSAGTYAAQSLIVSKVGDSTARFSNDVGVTTAGGTVTGVAFTAESTGPTQAAAGTLTVVANNPGGFNSATNPSDALVGSLAESNAAYRNRRDLELAKKGSTTADAIRADLLSALNTRGEPLFDFVSVIENDTDNVVDGRNPHSFETLVVTAADDVIIGAAILAVKPVGIRAYGLTDSVDVLDSQGNPHTIGWTFPDDVLIYISAQVNYIAGKYVGDDVVKQALVDWGETELSVGYDVLVAKLTQLIMDLGGVQDTYVTIDDAPGPTANANFVIGSRELARIALERIVLVGVPQAGHP
ncbi:MAG: hypothetical protein RLZZ450_92 [Pseudomonadota bacterium]|jgi:uncharacterized phage protein gp47/JayE